MVVPGRWCRLSDTVSVPAPDSTRSPAGLLEEWRLTPDGELRHGAHADVTPVRTESGRPVVLKVSRPGAPPGEAAAPEHLALQRWRGAGAVLMLRADPARRALLLERLHPEDLADVWDLDACEIVAGLYERLHVPASPALPSLAEAVAEWTARLADLPRSAPLPRRLVEQALALGRAFASDPATTGTVIHGNLHYGNVLAADREDWLAIAPRPFSGDPHLEPEPMLRHRWEDVTDAVNVRDAIRRRFRTLVDTAELDGDRARDWVTVRQVQRGVRALSAAAPTRNDEITRCVAIAKAVQE